MNRRKFVATVGLAPLAGLSAELSSAAVGKPLIVLPESARVYDTGHGRTSVLVGSEQSRGRWWLGSFLSDPGRKTSLHVHFSADEQMYVLEGILSVWLENGWKDLPTGALAVAPRGVAHALGNRTKMPVRFLVSGEPAGFERFFADLETIVRRHPYGSTEFLAELAAVYQKYNSQLLGPPPQG